MADSDWTKKGATLSDKSARTEFGLTQEEIIEAIRGGKTFAVTYLVNSTFSQFISF